MSHGLRFGSCRGPYTIRRSFIDGFLTQGRHWRNQIHLQFFLGSILSPPVLSLFLPLSSLPSVLTDLHLQLSYSLYYRSPFSSLSLYTAPVQESQNFPFFAPPLLRFLFCSIRSGLRHCLVSGLRKSLPKVIPSHEEFDIVRSLRRPPD